MSQPTTSINFNSTSPAAPTGNQNVKPQSDGATPQASVTFYPQVATDSLLGVVKPDGTTITITDDGVISAVVGGGGGGGTDVQFGSGSPLPVPPAVVQSAVGGGDFGGTLAFTSNVTEGNTLVVIVFCDNTSGGSIPVPTDTLGTTYTQLLGTSTAADTNTFVVFSGTASASASNTVSVGGEYQMSFAIAEVSGLAGGLDADGTSSTTGGGSVGVTTTVANDLVLLFLVTGGSAATYAVAGGSWTIAAQNDSFNNELLGSAVAASAGVQTYSWTTADSDGTSAIAVALKGSATGVSGSEGDIYCNTETTPYTQYVYHSGQWDLVGVVPDGTTIDMSASGVISVPTATDSALGTVKPDGSTITISDGVISVPTATTSEPGIVKPDGTTITISDGVISAVGGGGGGGTGGGASVIIGSGAPYGAQTVTSVQSRAALTNSVTTTNVVTEGNLLIVVGCWEAPIGTPTCSDTVGTVYTLVASKESAGGNAVCIFAGLAAGSAVNTATIASGSSNYAQTSISEFSGATATVDVSVTGDGNAPTPGPLSLTTTVGGDLIFAAVSGNHNGTTYSAGTGFTLNNFINDADAQATEWCQQSSDGAISASFGATDNDDYAMAMVAFEAVTGTGVTGAEGDLYFDTTTTPFTGYVYHASAWNHFS
jgi:hypothetical protein